MNALADRQRDALPLGERRLAGHVAAATAAAGPPLRRRRALRRRLHVVGEILSAAFFVLGACLLWGFVP